MNDQYRLPDLGPYIGIIIIVGLVLLVFLFPTVAAIVAPEGRRLTFFVLTLLFLPGPFGVGLAAIANRRPPGTPPGMRALTCNRCQARNVIDRGAKKFDCWRCDEKYVVP